MLMIAAVLGLTAIGWAVDGLAPRTSDEDEEDDELPVTPGGEVLPSPQTHNGTAGGDLLEGGGGNDSLNGDLGDDDLLGGLGNDTIYGGEGDDWLHGDGGYGLAGEDLLFGGAGDDYVAGDGGNDTIYGGSGDDTLLGGDGDDLVIGGNGRDWLLGNAGNDTLIAGADESDLAGGQGDDQLIGNADDSRAWLHGDEGNDTLRPMSGDYAEGGQGEDLFILPGTTPNIAPVIGDYDRNHDRIEIELESHAADEDPKIEIHRDGEGFSVISLDGEAIARVAGHSVRVEDLVVIRLSKAA